MLRHPQQTLAICDYDAVFDRVEESFSLFLSEGRPVQEPPGVLLAELAPLPPGEQGALSRDRRKAIPFLSKWLVARSHAVRHEDPGEMLQWALMARLAADSCSPEVLGSTARLADLRARAWGQLGNALRVCGRLGEAAEALATGEAVKAGGTGDPTLRAQLLSQIGSLQIAREEFLEAIESVEESAQLYAEIGETELQANSLLQQATAFHYKGEMERSLRLLDRTIPLIDPVQSPDLLLIARLNRARFSIDVDDSEHVFSAFFSARSLLPSRCSVLRLRATWQEGQMLAEVGALEAAESALLQAWEGYLQKGLVPESLAISGNLIALYRLQGNLSRLEQIAQSTRDALAKNPMDAEMLSSLQDLEGYERPQRGQLG